VGPGNQLNSVFFVDQNTGYAPGETGTMLKTIDGGTSFTDGLTGYAVGDGYLSGLNHGTIYKTTNGGSSWAPVCETNHGFWSVYFFDSGNGYAMGAGQSMIKTSDGGLTWSEIPFKEGIPSLLLTSCDFIDSHTGFAAGISGYDNTGLIFKTYDVGINWSM
jgi:photosystem II stability/assembly factor-like uncharacterized protein